MTCGKNLAHGLNCDVILPASLTEHFRNNPAPFFISNTKGQFFFARNSFARMLSYPSSDYIIPLLLFFRRNHVLMWS